MEPIGRDGARPFPSLGHLLGQQPLSREARRNSFSICVCIVEEVRLLISPAYPPNGAWGGALALYSSRSV